MLGYRLGEAPPLDLSILQKHRDDRNRKMHKKLVDLGLDVEWERIQAIAGEGQVGKPHLARALLQKGYVETIKEAFTKYLGKGMPAYVEKKRLTAVEGIRLLLDSGHAPVLAHPVSLGIGSSEYEPCLTFLKENGLVGLEVYHPDNDHHHTLLFKYLALKLGLVATNGSDFHGANKRTPLTWVLENSPLTLTVVGRLEEGLKETLRRLGLK
jgi:predicted metal-dependent phosphoesterase TrpH